MSGIYISAFFLGCCSNKECNNLCFSKKYLRCGRCKSVEYCCVECQKKDWKTHSLVCTEGKSEACENLRKIRDDIIMDQYDQPSFLIQLFNKKGVTKSFILALTEKELKNMLKTRKWPSNVKTEHWDVSDKNITVGLNSDKPISDRLKNVLAVRLQVTMENGIVLYTHFSITLGDPGGELKGVFSGF